MQVFNVQGMSCAHCVRAITQAVQALDSTAEVRVDLAAKEVVVSSSRLSAEQVLGAISEEGYEAKLAG
ncbi:heavy-metal-associated domain-containing protein [Pseudomonas sp. FEN]|uniref:heavy-metal-associated domain-containing protein n=1 Tax=Pseudomonas sp. FEN TaxID=2767468 RepID=UPI00174CB0FA|nr:cation transporter [Pseudomonas sp. FEN]